MKVAYLIILLFAYASAKATIYYVDYAGNDLNSGTSKATPWKTIRKVNASTFLPGDQVLFKAGDVWNERLIIPSSGSPSKVITFGSYGTGAKPVITGLQSQSGFTKVGNIWTAKATSSVPNLNTVLIKGSIRAKARYPNTGYLTFTSYNKNTQITGSLSGSPDYTGAEIVVRSTHWTLDVSKITSQHRGTINFSPPLSYIPNFGGNGYFIQNIPSVLDTLDEWTFDSNSKILKIYSLSLPTVEISTIDTLIYIYNKKYITFEGLSLQGANITAFKLHTTNNITIRNCSFNYSGSCAISGVLSSHLSIIGDSIQNSLGNAIYLVTSDFAKPGCDYALIDHNYIKNSGIMAGMGEGKYAKFYGIYISGTHPTITNNRIDSTGYIPIMFIGRNSIVKNNFITNFCFVKDDGGAIYTYIGKYYPSDYNSGSIIRSNIIINGMGAGDGTLPSNTSPAAGIYLDENSQQIIVDSNTISNCKTSAISLNSVKSIVIKENTVINNPGAGLAIYGKNEFVSDLNIKRNIFFSQNPQQPKLIRTYGTSIGSIDSNYYARPGQEFSDFSLDGFLYKLPDWNSKTGQDANSISISLKIPSSARFIYNPKKSDSTISLYGTYVDAKGRVFKNSITLHSFCSAIVFKKQ